MMSPNERHNRALRSHHPACCCADCTGELVEPVDVDPEEFPEFEEWSPSYLERHPEMEDDQEGAWADYHRERSDWEVEQALRFVTQ
jgi:hypothetical protein